MSADHLLTEFADRGITLVTDGDTLRVRALRALTTPDGPAANTSGQRIYRSHGALTVVHKKCNREKGAKIMDKDDWLRFLQFRASCLPPIL